MKAKGGVFNQRSGARTRLLFLKAFLFNLHSSAFILSRGGDRDYLKREYYKGIKACKSDKFFNIRGYIMKPKLPGIKRLVIGIASAALLSLPCALYADQTYSLKIASQNLGPALMTLGESAGVEILLTEEVGRSTSLAALEGEYTLSAALETMLAGTGLTYEFVSEDSVVIKSNAVDANEQSSIVRQKETFIEEVIVTAEKRAESVQDIPIAISAFYGDILERAGVNEMMDLQFKTTSLQIADSGAGETQITLRGVTTGLINLGSESGTSVSQDGVPFVRQVLMDADFLDVERVEVLKGPQGTISGRNATGGAINIHSKIPTDSFEGNVKLTTGNYNLFAAEGYLSGPVPDTNVMGRIAFSTEKADGWLKNTLYDNEMDDRDKAHIRGSLLADINNNVEGLVIVDALWDRSVPQSLFAYGQIRPDMLSLGEFASVGEIDTDSGDFEADQESHGDKYQLGITLRLNWAISESSNLTSTTGYWDLEFEHGYDCDGTRLAVCALPLFNFNSTQVSQELTLATDLSDNVDLILGGYVLREMARQPTEFSSSEYFGGFVVASAGTVRQELNSYALYSQVRFRLTENLRLSIGARYTMDEKDYIDIEGVTIPLNESWNGTTPRVAIDYSPANGLTFYASVSRGFKAGGFNTFQVPQAPFDPEFVWSYEGGVKAKLFDDRVWLTSSIFYMDYTDMQQASARLVEGPGGPVATIQVTNTAASEIKGVEFEIDAALSDKFMLGLAGTWLDTEAKDLLVPDPIYPELGVFDPVLGLNIRDHSGNQLPRAPEWQFALSGEYNQPFGNLNGVFRVDYSWRSSAHLTIFNHAGDEQGAYGIVNLYAGIESADGRWGLSTYVHNATDEVYITHRGPNPAGLAPVPFNLANFGRPRMYGVSFNLNF